MKKKTVSVSDHFVREGICADEWRTAYIDTKLNLADIMTKNLSAGEKILFDIHYKIKNEDEERYVFNFWGIITILILREVLNIYGCV